MLSRRWIYVAAIVLVTAVCAVPVLSYVHDQLTAGTTTHFRPGKNIERPHEQHVLLLASEVQVSRLQPPDTGVRLVSGHADHGADAPPVSPVPPRAPPAR